jgi:hypothetical protein
MNKIHNALVKKNQWYRAWHGEKHAALTHWVLLILILVLAGLVVSERVLGPDSSSYGLQSSANGQNKKTLSGKLDHFHTDNFGAGTSQEFYYLIEDGGKRYKLNLPKNKAVSIQSGSEIMLTGTVSGDSVSLAPSDISVIAEPASVAATATKQVAVILFNFQNDTSQPWTSDFVRSVVFTGTSSVKKYYEEASFGQWAVQGKYDPVNGDVFGWYTVPYNNVNCSDLSVRASWINAATAQAQAQGIDFSGYTNIVYAFPHIPSVPDSQGGACGWVGIGGNTTALIHGVMAASVVGHELGHGFTLQHASNYSCTASGVRVSISDTCTWSEYGDPFDIMGSGNTNHANAFHKGQQISVSSPNWFLPENKRTINKVNNPDGTYTLAPIEQSSTGLQSLRFVRGVNPMWGILEYYYLEFRQPFGFDNFLSSAPVVNGVSLRLAGDYNTMFNSFLVDATPTTLSYVDAPLTVGQTFVDAAKEITVTVVSVSSAGAQVRVKFGPVAPPPPPPPPPGPTVTITQPAAGSRLPSKGKFNLSAGASDSAGIAKIELFFDNVSKKICLNVTSCSASMNSNGVGSGSHTVKAVATNRTNATGQASATVTK